MVHAGGDVAGHSHKDQHIRRSHHEEAGCQSRSAVRRVTSWAAKTMTPLAKALAKCDHAIWAVALSPFVDIRYYRDPDTGLPHKYGHGVTEEKVEQFLRSSSGDIKGSRGSRMKLGRTSAGRYLQVIYSLDEEPESVFVITAYELSGNAKTAYRRRRRRKPR
jgi:hypothetical protein